MSALAPVAQAAVVGRDRRGPLSRLAERKPFSFSLAESARLRNTTGYVFCPGAKDQRNAFGSSGFLVGTATDMYVVTAAHAFIDERGYPRQPLGSCTFTSFGLGSESIPLLFKRKNGATYETGAFDPEKDTANDFMIVRLSRPSPDAQPFKLGTKVDLSTLDETRLFAVSALMDGYDAGTDPILQNCGVRRVFKAHDARPSIAYTDCAAKVGASGSGLFTRVGGELTPVALIRGSKHGPDGLPYDEASENYTYVIALDGRLLDLAQKVMGASY